MSRVRQTPLVTGLSAGLTESVGRKKPGPRAERSTKKTLFKKRDNKKKKGCGGGGHDEYRTKKPMENFP